MTELQLFQCLFCWLYAMGAYTFSTHLFDEVAKTSTFGTIDTWPFLWTLLVALAVLVETLKPVIRSAKMLNADFSDEIKEKTRLFRDEVGQGVQAMSDPRQQKILEAIKAAFGHNAVHFDIEAGDILVDEGGYFSTMMLFQPKPYEHEGWHIVPSNHCHELQFDLYGDLEDDGEIFYITGEDDQHPITFAGIIFVLYWFEIQMEKPDEGSS